MSALPQRKITLEQYFAIERDSEIRYEFIDGEIYAMSGGSRSHESIVGDTYSSLDSQLREKGCDVYPSNLRILLHRV